jgi:phasin family protein
MEAQVAFLNDLSKSMFRSFQQMCDLNIQLAQTMLEETTLATHQITTHQRPTEALSAASARAQPAADKLRAYQQHLSRVAAEAQVELARVTEKHVAQTSRTAKILADEVQRAASEETERGIRTQQETMRKFSDPFQTSPGMRGNGSGGASASASMQGAQGGSHMAGSGSEHQGSAGSMQSAPAQAAQGAPAGKGTGASGSRKET